MGRNDGTVGIKIARGVLDALRDHGRSVPRDVAVVGFDNWEIIASQARPPLTTVDMNLHDLGRNAAEQGAHARLRTFETTA